MAAGDVYEKVAGAWVKRTTLTVPAAASPPVEVPLTLLNGWAIAYTGTYGNPRVIKNADGVCRLAGVAWNVNGLTEANFQNPIATLPPGYRPATAVITSCWSVPYELAEQGQIRIQISTNGDVILSEAYLPGTIAFFDGSGSWVGA